MFMNIHPRPSNLLLKVWFDGFSTRGAFMNTLHEVLFPTYGLKQDQDRPVKTFIPQPKAQPVRMHRWKFYIFNGLWDVCGLSNFADLFCLLPMRLSWLMAKPHWKNLMSSEDGHPSILDISILWGNWENRILLVILGLIFSWTGSQHP